MQSKKSYPWVINVDVPDPDNIAMILYILAVYKGRVAIVLSPRIVDLSVARYGKEFPKMVKTLRFETMYEPIKENEKPDVPEKWKDFFRPDSTLSDLEVVEDTELYMRVSKMRIIECIKEQHPRRNNYKIFWDPESLSKIKEPDMRHALHVADYAFNFNDAERKRYEEITQKPSGSSLRESLRVLCNAYIDRIIEDIDHRRTAKLSNIEKLFKANLRVKGTTLIIGGPLTEALQYIKNTKSRPKAVYAMLGTLTRDRNILGKPQFNIGKDPKSAHRFLKNMSKNQIPMFTVPTECCKGRDQEDPCPYAFQEHEWKELFKNSPLMLRIVGQWLKERGATQFLAFDLIAAIPMERKIFDWVSVTYEARRIGEVIKDIEFSITEESSCILMAEANYERMSKRKKRMQRQVKRAFQETGPCPLGSEDSSLEPPVMSMDMLGKQ
ncbi:hypothetical protein DDE82_009137 [Stemphylium lycopersici]|nr:hypothetical protein TW65_09349 [Stemphylium lycopersici]RAQ98560.1 hypothetical protein DDE82_009137 [Stemphylium lycopersici]